jgi:hypothetical protein
MPKVEIARQSTPLATATDRHDGELIPVWIRVVAALGALLMVAGAVIAILNPAMLVSPHAEINEGVRVYAGYLTSRNLGIALLLVAAIALRARGMLNTLMLLAATVQLLDAGIDCVEGRWAIAPGVTVLGILFLIASARLSGHPFWRIKAWRFNDKVRLLE